MAKPTGDPALKSGRRRRLRDQVKAQRLPCQAPQCYLPGIPIDYLAKRGPTAYVLGEIVPRALGGSATDPGNVRPEHHRCNAKAGAKLGNRQRWGVVQLRRSRVW